MPSLAVRGRQYPTAKGLCRHRLCRVSRLVLARVPADLKGAIPRRDNRLLILDGKAVLLKCT